MFVRASGWNLGMATRKVLVGLGQMKMKNMGHREVQHIGRLYQKDQQKMNDYLSSAAASEGLARKVRDWWAKRGYAVRVVVSKERLSTLEQTVVEGEEKKVPFIHVVRMDYSPSVDAKRGIL